jgi:hypothetical protein
MDELMLVNVGFSAVNSVLLIVLLSLYAKIVFKTKAIYPAGLFIFALFLLGQNLLAVFSYVDMQGYFGTGVLPYLCGIGALQLVSLIALLRVTL